MTRSEVKSADAAVKELLLQNPEGLREVVRAVMQEVLEAEMKRSAPRRASARLSGSATGPAYGRTLITRVGKLELRVPQDRGGRFSTELFERLPEIGASARGHLGGDVCSRRLDPQGEGDH